MGANVLGVTEAYDGPLVVLKDLTQLGIAKSSIGMVIGIYG